LLSEDSISMGAGRISMVHFVILCTISMVSAACSSMVSNYVAEPSESGVYLFHQLNLLAMLTYILVYCVISSSTRFLMWPK